MADCFTLDQPIVPIAEANPAAVEALLDVAFGRDRHARTAYRIRAGTTALDNLSFAALSSSGALRGSLQSWPVALDDHPLILVGPVAVAPDCRDLGIGGALMRRLIARAEACGAPPLVLIGDLEYYGRFGFDAAATGGWSLPGPVERHRLLARVPAGITLPTHGMLGPR